MPALCAHGLTFSVHVIPKNVVFIPMETKNTARKRGLSNGKEAIENEKLIKSISTTNPWGMVYACKSV